MNKLQQLKHNKQKSKMLNIFKYSITLFFVIISNSIFGQFDNEILEFYTKIKVERGKLIEENSYLIQINNKHSNWISEIEIPYTKDERIEILEAFIIDSKGNIVRYLKKKDVITRNHFNYGTFYSDYMVKEFKLKWSSYPYRISYNYRKTTDKFVYVAKWYPYVYEDVPTKKAILKVEFPSNYKVKLNYPKNFVHEVSNTNSIIQHYWETANLTPLEEEILSPPFMEMSPKVVIIPEEFEYGIKGSFSTWKSFGFWQHHLNNNLYILPEEEKVNVNTIIKGISDRKEIIKKLYHYLQDNTRYINVTTDIGGLKPYSASYVSNNKYGDCKALSIYMKALLKHANIKSYYTKIYSGINPIRINKDLPSQQFNHIILCVPMQSDTIWLENTASFYPYNYLGTTIQDRYALLVDGKNSKLVKTPALTSEEVMTSHIYNFNINIEGTGDVTITSSLKGRAFEKYKYIETEYNEKDQRDFIENDLPIKNHELNYWNFSQDDRDSSKLTLTITANVKDQINKVGNMLVLPTIPLNIPEPEKPEFRKNSLRINYPIHKIDSIIYNLPVDKNYKIQLPEDVYLKTDCGIYKENYVHVNDQLIINRSFQLYKQSRSLNEYISFYSFIHSIKSSVKKSIIILNPL